MFILSESSFKFTFDSLFCLFGNEYRMEFCITYIFVIMINEPKKFVETN